MTFRNVLNGYRIVFTSQAAKDLKKIEKKEVKKIKEKLEDLIAGQQNVDVKKLEGQDESTYRLRCGDYRVIYQVQEQEVVVLVVEVKHRKEVYRNR